ncbi:hypothetical protein C8F04DRAFT_1120727 [Mycena alexandri]|uniref:Uncharacterized protein n=1 Tax=Mycena alexandri TaxID=1745969 RepID=A0AAD6SI21_9AGAR|nr:hypothetical protein C8F04DRAFT_1120727 [Mycena alexandri]
MFTSATSSYMKPSERVRRQWRAFAQWVETGPRVEMERGITENFHNMDAKWNATTLRTRPSKQDHEKSKATFRRELEDGLVTIAREEWQRRLEAAGLKDEDWGEMTFKETLAVERLLGGDLDEEGMAIMESVARAEDAEVIALPGLTNATRSANTSGYSFVSPMSLNVGDELDDETDAFESIFPYEVPPSSGPESITDDIFDAPTSVPRGWKGDAHSYGIWSADTSQSSRQSSQTGSPERLPPKPMPAEHAFFSRVADSILPLHPESRSTATIRARAPALRYFGPVLTETFDNDALSEEEEAEEFERFKMETRVTKIREFHEEAARADIQLAQDIYNARKMGGNSHDDEHKILEHQKRMVELQRTKEEERKAVVRAERAVRLEAIDLRKKQLQNKPTATGESPRDRLAQEVASKLKLGNVVAIPDPLVPVETRRGRRQSQSTMSTTSSQSSRTTAPPPDRLAASVPDLLSALSSVSSTASSTPVSSGSSSASQAPSRWLPGAFPDVVTAAPPTKASKKKAAPSTPAPAASASASAKKQQNPKSTSDTSKPPSIVADPQLPSVVPSSTVPTLFSPPPTVTKPVISTASKAKAPSAAGKSKGQSPPVTSKGPSTTVTATKAPPSSAPSIKTQAPPPSAKAQPPPAPAPPVETPKPTPSVAVAPSALPQKKLRTQTVEMPHIQTPGASSSRTTLEQMQRPFMHKSLGGEGWVDPGARPFNGCIPHPTVPGRGTKWVSSSSAANKISSASMTMSSSAASQSSQIEKTISMPQPRLPSLASSTRPRRMSDPISPSPRSFAFPEDGQAAAPDAVPVSPSILKAATAQSKGKGKGKSKRVTIEEVSDEEDADALERLPIDSKVIFEPKPSVPPTMFSSIIDFAPQPPPPAAPASVSSSGSTSGKHPRSNDGLLTDDGNMAKAKHVRWTPSTVGGGNPAARSSGLENDQGRAAVETSVPAPQVQAQTAKKGPRSRASSLLQTSTSAVVVDRKGKGKERAVQKPEGDEDDFAQFMMGATQNLTQMRG